MGFISFLTALACLSGIYLPKISSYTMTLAILLCYTTVAIIGYDFSHCSDIELKTEFSNLLKFMLFAVLTYFSIFSVPFTINFWIVGGLNSIFYLASTFLVDHFIVTY